MRKAAKDNPYYVTFNVPEPGYFECTWCGRPTSNKGLCDDCNAILADLEKQLAYRRGEDKAFSGDPAIGND